MTDYTVQLAKHATITAGNGNGDRVTFGRSFPGIEIINRSVNPGEFLSVTIARGRANEDDQAPTLDGDNTYYVGPNSVRVIRDDQFQAPISNIRLVGSASFKYSATGVDD